MIAADVAVVGAGPAGSATATTLSRAGLKVVLIDKARFPRDKCCGDGLTTTALRRLEGLGLHPSSVESWLAVNDIWLRSPSGHTAALSLPRGQGTYAAVARRADLDCALLKLATESGAEVHEAHALRGVRWSASSVELEVDGVDTVSAPYVVAADGMWSPLRKAVLAGSEETYLGEWYAFRQYFHGVDAPARSGMWVWFEPDLLPGYVWSFPLPGGCANVGLGIRRRPGQPTGEMRAMWEDVLSRSHVRDVLGDAAQPEAAPRGWPIPTQARAPLSGAGGRVLFAGDAGRLADPLTGEGVGQALESGILAATALLSAGARSPHQAAARYQRAVRTGLGIDNHLSGALSGLLRHHVVARAAVRVAAHGEWTKVNFSRWMMEDYPRAAVLTPWRWHRHLLSGPGAYVAGSATTSDGRPRTLSAMMFR